MPANACSNMPQPGCTRKGTGGRVAVLHGLQQPLYLRVGGAGRDQLCHRRLDPAPSRRTDLTKGAVEEMLAIASHIEEHGQALPLDEARRTALQALAQEYNRQGFRVLCSAPAISGTLSGYNRGHWPTSHSWSPFC